MGENLSGSGFMTMTGGAVDPRVGVGPSTTLLSEELNGGRTLHVNPATGNLILEEVDVVIAGTAGFDFELARTFNSLDAGHVADLGIGWRGPFTSANQLSLDSGGTALWYARPGDGWGVEFVKDGNGDWQPQRSLDATLTENVGGDFTLEWHATGLLEHYDVPDVNEEAELVSYEDRNGNTIAVAYSSGLISSATDTQNRVTTFTHSGGFLTEVSDPASREHLYDVDGHSFTVSPGRRLMKWIARWCARP